MEEMAEKDKELGGKREKERYREEWKDGKIEKTKKKGIVMLGRR